MGIGQPFQDIVSVAYQCDKLHTVATADLPNGKYDFFAKLVPAQEPHQPLPSDESWASKLQEEIRTKFGVIGRKETRKANVLVLKPTESGTHGLKVSHSMPEGQAFKNPPGNFECFEQPVSTLISFLQQYFKIPIIDQTELLEKYDFALKWDEQDRQHPNLDGLKQALHSQLGLDLVPTNMPIEMLVIEKVK